MDLSETFGRIQEEDAWRYPIIAGLTSIPFTLILQMFSAGTYVLAPVLVAGLLVGYLFRDQQTESRRVGWRTGLVGGTALLWGAFEFSMLIPETTQTVSIGVVSASFLTVVILLYIVLYGVVGAIGGVAGGRIAERIGRTRAPAGSE